MGDLGKSASSGCLLQIAVFPVRYPETLAAKSSTYTPTTAAPSQPSSSQSASEPEEDHQPDARLKEVPMCRKEGKSLKFP